MIRETVLEIFANVWPMVFITSVIMVSLRITYLLKNKQEFIFYKELLLFGFVIYVICLFYVVSFQDVSWSTSNFIPFKEMFRYTLGSNLFIRNVIGNILIFMPFGFFTGYFLKLDKGITAFILSLLVSSSIEVTQLYIGRVFDIDDILLNVLGGMCGYLLYKSLDIINDLLPKPLKTNVFYNIIVSIFLFLIVFYLLNVGGIV